MTTTFGLPKSDKGAKGHALFFTQVTDAINALETADTNSTNLFDAHSILAATADNTPAALTVGASTFVGRKATGNISAMSVSEVKTLLGYTAVTGVAVDAAGIHAALVTLGLITA